MKYSTALLELANGQETAPLGITNHDRHDAALRSQRAIIGTLATLAEGQEVQQLSILELQAVWRIRLSDLTVQRESNDRSTRWVLFLLFAVGGVALQLAIGGWGPLAFGTFAFVVSIGNTLFEGRRYVKQWFRVKELADTLHLLEVKPPTVAWIDVLSDVEAPTDIEPPPHTGAWQLPTDLHGQAITRMEATPARRRPHSLV